MRQRGWLVIALAAMAIALVLGRGLTTLIADRLWYAALDASGVWREKVWVTLAWWGGAWVLGSAFAFANLWAVRQTILAVAVPARVANLEIAEMIPSRRLFTVALLLALMVGAVLTASLDDWTVLSMALRGEAFNEYEGFFQRDLGFYVYWLPLESAVYLWTLVAVVVVTTLVTLLYALTRSLRLEGRRLVASTHVRRHLTALGALVLVLLAWSYRLDAYDLLSYGSGFDGLFARVDHVYTIKADLVLAVGTLAAALIVLRAGWLGHVRTAFVAVSLVLLGALVFRQAMPIALANGTLLGAETVRDVDYEGTRTLVTRRAYDLDRIAVARSGSGEVSSLRQGVSVWDASALLRASGQGDGGPQLVTPPTWIAGPEGLRAILLERTVGPESLWQLRTVGATPTESGGPPLVQFAMSGRSAAGARAEMFVAGAFAEPLVAPEVSGHRLVRIASPVISAMPGISAGADPFSDRTVVAARLSSPASRLAHAWATRDASLLRADSLGEQSALVLHRGLRERLTRLFPVFVQGSVVTPVLYDGGLFWAVDLYSASSEYPLSVRFQIAGRVLSYFHHAGTALVDARTGRVRVIPVSAPDAIARTWFARVPSLLVQAADVPNDLLDQRPPPTDGVMAQLRGFSRVGARGIADGGRYVPDSMPGAPPFPAVLVGNTPGAPPRVAWSVPVIDDRSALSGVMSAVGGPAPGALWTPIAGSPPSWDLLRQRLVAAVDVYEADSTRERIRPGHVRVLISNGRPLLVQPLYSLRADAGGPRLTAVAVVGDTVSGVAPTVADAARLAGEAVIGTTAPAAEGTTPPPTQADVSRLYEVMRDALRRGDWLRFGTAFDSLGLVLGRLPE